MPYQVDGASSALQKSVLKDNKGCISSSEMFQLQEWFSTILGLCTLSLKFLHFIVSIFNVIFWFTVCFYNFYVFSCDFYLLDGPITKLAHLEDRLKEIKYISVISVHVLMSITKMWEARNHLCSSVAWWFGDHKLTGHPFLTYQMMR